MTADTYDSILGLIQQGTGNNNNSWGTVFNTSFATMAARAIGGVNTITSTGGTVDYSTVVPPAGARLDIDAIQLANGALTSDLTIVVPNISKMWWFQNNTSGNFNMYVKTPSGNPTQIPQGVGRTVMCDGNNNCIRGDKDDIGAIRISGKFAAGPGEMYCGGQSLVRTEFPDLYNAIGTTWGSVDSTHFTLPQFGDTSRYLRQAVSGLGLNVGTYQSNQNKSHTHTGSGTSNTESAVHFHNGGGATGNESVVHTHSGSGTTSGVNTFHTHTGSGTTGNSNQSLNHTHTYDNFQGGAKDGSTAPGGASSPGGGTTSAVDLSGHNHAYSFTTGGDSTDHSHSYSFTTGGDSVDHSHAYSFTTGGDSVDHTHAYSFTTSTGSADGSEARPESAAVMMAIRY